MYITHCRNQRAIDVVDTTQYRFNITAGTLPTYLIRVSDWKKVTGEEAKSGYCALSYCWIQFGEVVQKEDGEYDWVGNGKHCIVEGYDMGLEDSVILVATKEEDGERVPQFRHPPGAK